MEGVQICGKILLFFLEAVLHLGFGPSVRQYRKACNFGMLISFYRFQTFFDNFCKNKNNLDSF